MAIMYDVDASFTFIDDLHIESSSHSLESEESLTASLVDIDSKIQGLGNEIIALQRRISELEQRKSSIQSCFERISSSKIEIRLGKPSLYMQASPSEKANFLFELFHGRRDVYAIRNWNEKTGKAAYYPVCSKNSRIKDPLVLDRVVLIVNAGYTKTFLLRLSVLGTCITTMIKVKEL